ncbi:cation:H+ antiporter [Alkalibaculum bacchi]|uniref:Cation:H+ antiporter n=1 Tax=Alkalibaculum bacchi TaxID=645887 RepID=A0A366I7A5_9FIRM|nr:sodium:calcium antiporter [Alkalibaculum bacchi]RBP63312.1 cation:H+ antiporter [Alkalibaculum bacchi]
MYSLLIDSSIIVIFIIFCISLFLLSKAADYLVDNAVKLSQIWGLPEIIIGATIVSLGTTLPELSASISSALKGNDSFALGNAVGSIITNTSLILGIGALFGKIPVGEKSSQKFNLLVTTVFLLIFTTLPYKVQNEGSYIPQWVGFIYLMLVMVYIVYLIIQEKNRVSISKKNKSGIQVNKNTRSVFMIIFSIFISALVIAVSASSLVNSAEILARRIGISDVIIASTLVAFGTSVPELSTCISAAKRNHGGLVIGNIMGANILNILLVVGASAALIPGGIAVTEEFYRIHFTTLAIVLSVFGFFAYNSKINEISKREGMILILIYILYLFINFL